MLILSIEGALLCMRLAHVINHDLIAACTLGQYCRQDFCSTWLQLKVSVLLLVSINFDIIIRQLVLIGIMCMIEKRTTVLVAHITLCCNLYL